MSRESGTALIEMLVLGFATVLLVVPVFMGVSRVTDATNGVHAAANDAALWVARHGVLPPDVDEAVDLTIVIEDDRVFVVGSTDVAVFGAGAWHTSMHVTRRVVVPVSPYRSRTP